MPGNFREYAASFWYQHVKSDGPHYDKVLEQMKGFFCPMDDNWERWRQRFDKTVVDGQMIHYEGDIIMSSCLFYAGYLGFSDLIHHWMKILEQM